MTVNLHINGSERELPESWADESLLMALGAGETALIAAVPALANALRDATGFRATRLPVGFNDLAGATA